MLSTTKFAENLFLLMSERNLNAPKLALELDIDRTSITEYLRGKRFPNFKALVAMLNFFNVSADVFLGRADYSSSTELHPIAPFGTTLRKVMEETRTTQHRIEKELHISGGTMYYWLINKSLPTVLNLDKLADFMDVSIDYLLGRVH